MLFVDGENFTIRAERFASTTPIASNVSTCAAGGNIMNARGACRFDCKWVSTVEWLPFAAVPNTRSSGGSNAAKDAGAANTGGDHGVGLDRAFANSAVSKSGK